MTPNRRQKVPVGAGSGFLRGARERFRLQELDSLTEDARSRERHKRVILTAATSMGGRLLGLATGLIAVPLTLGYLGAEQYGLWVTITSVAALMGFADLGLSNGLMNAVSEADGRNDREGARQYISSAFYMLTLLALGSTALFAVLYGIIPWPNVFNVTSRASSEVAGPAAATFIIITLLSLPLGAVARIQFGYQEGFKSSFWQAAGSLLSVAGLVLAIAARATLPWLVFALGIGPVIASLLNGRALIRQRPWLAPSISAVNRRAARTILRLGLLFLVLQIAVVVSYQIDNIIIAQILGAAQVTQYAVPFKLFMLVPAVLGFGLMPLWPAYREALSRGDNHWVRRTLTRSLRFTLGLSIPAAAGLVVFGKPLIQVWVGDTVQPTPFLLLGLGTWTVVYSMSIAVAMLLNGANAIAFQVVMATFMTITNLVSSIALTNLVGLSGPAWGSTISVLICVMLPSAWFLRRFLRRLSVPDGLAVS